MQTQRHSPAVRSPQSRGSPCRAVYPVPPLVLPSIEGSITTAVLNFNNSAGPKRTLDQTMNSTMNNFSLNSTATKRGTSHHRNISNITLIMKSPQDGNLMEQIQDELLMKEQLMQKRYDRFLKISDQIKEDVSKKNVDQK